MNICSYHIITLLQKTKKTNQCNFQNEMLHVWARKIAFKSLKNHGNVLIKKSESPWRSLQCLSEMAYFAGLCYLFDSFCESTHL